MSFAKTVWQLDLQTLEYSQLTPMPEEAFVDRFAWHDGRIIGAGGEKQDRVSPAAVGMDLHRGVPAGIAAGGLAAPKPNFSSMAGNVGSQSTKGQEGQKDIHEGARRTTKGHEEKKNEFLRH